MKINEIKVQNEGYVSCRSGFYTAQDLLSADVSYTFTPGVNKLVGEIDSGSWAVSYLLSMYPYRPKDFVLFEPPEAVVNDKRMPIGALSTCSCYMDASYPLFSGHRSVEKGIRQGLARSKSGSTVDEVVHLFDLAPDRCERPLAQVGNERFRAMAAIGFAHGKELFCFPWLSNRRFEGYHENLTGLLQLLEDSGKMAIVPVGAEHTHAFDAK